MRQSFTERSQIHYSFFSFRTNFLLTRKGTLLRSQHPMGGKLGQCEIRIFPHSHPEADSLVSGQTKRLFCSERRPADIRAFSGMKFSKEAYLGAKYIRRLRWEEGG